MNIRVIYILLAFRKKYKYFFGKYQNTKKVLVSFLFILFYLL